MKIGVVPQFDNLDPDFTAAENLIVYGRYFGMADAEIRPLIPELLDFAGLAGKEKANIRTLSGGMKRRLTLARALVNDPELLLLDEPTTGLDPQARHLIWERLKRLQAQGKTILLTTHFMDEAERLCQRLAIIDDGRMVAEGRAARADRGSTSSRRWSRSMARTRRLGRARSHRPFRAASRVSGETAFCYVEDAAPLLAHLAAWPACAPCTGRRTWKTCSSSSPAGAAGLTAASALHTDPGMAPRHGQSGTVRLS
jgi:lipooligosaccharide transport system ATP-binding protein